MDAWDGKDRRNGAGWHLKREISVGHLLTTATIAIAGMSYVIQNEKNHSTHAARLDALQSIVRELKASDLRQDGKTEAVVTRIEQKIERMEDKMDKALARRP